ncbi:MAG TPA: hypothetical protein VEH81_08115 [Ktedonobacteraceae bacterium]|nr:hypothetical protein [Ktedonobacteraceae bacterium]
MSSEMGTRAQNENALAITSNSKTRLSGTRLIIARVVWLALVIPTVILFIASLPVFYAQIQKPCVDVTTCNIYGTLTANGLQGLLAIGLSASSYAAFVTIFFTILVAIWSGIGFLIFWRRSDVWFALLTAFFLVMNNITYSGSPIYALALAYPALNVPVMCISVLGQASIIVFLFLFPNGRLVPRWIGLFLLLGIITSVFSVLPANSLSNSNNWPSWLNLVLEFPTYGAIIFSQIYRYRKVSTYVERQQTKWVVLGIISVVIGLLVFPFIFNGPLSSFNQPNTPYSLIQNIIYPVLLLLLPLSIGIAIMRYQLWDIDRIINRTLVYGTLTAILALVYFGLIFILQYLLRGIINQNNDVAIVISTLTIAALFQPLRHRIQRIIDHRFYRSKYDATKIIANFNATLREEVDLDTLRKELIAVVQETMQPVHVSLWLRKPEREVKHE